jgi:AraC family cel operon transcriptional repressor
MRHLLIADFLGPRHAGHFARNIIRGDNDEGRLHDHDFVEVFWVSAGLGTLITPAGAIELKTGDAVLVAPSDAHGFSGGRREALRITNLAVPTKRWERLVAHLGIDDPLAWEATERRRRLPGSGLAALEAAAMDCDQGRRDTLAVERVLMAVLAAFRPATEPIATAPDWLAAALTRFRAGGWRRGLPALVAACGRSREHVARTCRTALGRSPAALLAEIRLAALADALVTDERPVTELIADCGFANPTHAYRLFRRAYGLNPGAWRERQRAIVGG